MLVCRCTFRCCRSANSATEAASWREVSGTTPAPTRRAFRRLSTSSTIPAVLSARWTARRMQMQMRQQLSRRGHRASSHASKHPRLRPTSSCDHCFATSSSSGASAMCLHAPDTHTHTHTHTRLTALCPGLPLQVSRYQKGKTNLEFTEARDSEWQWHQLGHMQDCTSLQTDNHASTPPLSFFTGRMPFLPPNQQRQSNEGRTYRAKNGATDSWP